jgi:ParB-like chromosome segregation protein Spo0J
MTALRIDDLLANAPVDPEAHLDAERVERYAGRTEALPPVVVFDTEEGLLLADGYHRVAAARRRGLETIEAEVRLGSRQDALRYAARVGAAQRGISPEEAASYVRRRSQRRRGLEALTFRTSEKAQRAKFRENPSRHPG